MTSLVDLYDETDDALLVMKFIKVPGKAPVHNLYFDETEKDNDIIGVAGWLGTIEKFKLLERLWQEMLPPEAGGDFHYVDFWNDPTHWAALWQHDERLNFILNLARIIRECSSCGIGIIFKKTEFRKAVADKYMPPNMGPFQFSFGQCVRGLLGLNGNFEHPPTPWRVMFDHKACYEGELASVYYGARAAFNAEATLGNLSFGNRREEPVLQAADLLIGEMLRRLEGRPSVVMDFLMEKKEMFIVYPTEADFKKYIQLVIEAVEERKKTKPS